VLLNQETDLFHITSTHSLKSKTDSSIWFHIFTLIYVLTVLSLCLRNLFNQILWFCEHW